MRRQVVQFALLMSVVLIMLVPTGPGSPVGLRSTPHVKGVVVDMAPGTPAAQRTIPSTDGLPSTSGPGQVNWTLCLSSNNLTSGNNGWVCATGMYPIGTAYDSANGDVYVANYGSNNVSAVSGATNRVVAAIPVGSYPYGVTFDPSNGDLYVTDSGSDNVSVVSGATNKVVSTLAVGSGPWGVTYDSTNDEIYVCNSGSSSLSVISGATNTVVGTIAVGSGPHGLAFDSSNGDIYVANSNSGNVSVVSGSSNTVVATVPIGSGVPWGPEGATFDPVDGDIYVTNYGSNNMSVVAGTTNTVVANLRVGSAPAASGFDVANGDVYVANSGSNNMSVVSGTTNKVVATIPVGTNPWGVTYGTSTHNVYVTDYSSGTLSIIVTGSSSPLNATLTASTTSGSAPLAVTFNGVASGGAPPYNYAWNFGDGATGSGASVTHIYTTAGAYTARLTVTDSVGNAATASVGITVKGSGSGGPYNVTFAESGLPSSLPVSWSVNFNNQSSGSIPPGAEVVYQASDGTYPFTIGEPAGYVANPSSGQITVSGAPFTETVRFTCVLNCTYPVTFNESGLPIGTSWSVSVKNVATFQAQAPSPVVADLANGSYTYSIPSVGVFIALPQGGSLSVNGRPIARNISFVPDNYYGYNITFSETGLPMGMEWYVSYASSRGGGELMSSQSSMVLSDLSNGTYSYWVNSVPGYTANPTFGNLSLIGKSNAVNVTFSPLPKGYYSIIFGQAAAGFPSGTNWSVTLANTTLSSGGPEVTFDEANGSYSFNVGIIPGYKSSPRAGSIVVSGAAVYVDVYIIPTNSYFINFTEVGLPPGTRWGVGLSCPGMNSGEGGVSQSFTLWSHDGTCSYTIGKVSGFASNPSSGSVVVNGKDVSVMVTFSRTYEVTFREAGLPVGTSWSVSLNGSTNTSSSAVLSFEATNGTYLFTVGGVGGYVANLTSGTVRVVGSTISESVGFRAVYALSFVEEGLPTGTNWSVTLNGTTNHSTGATISFTVGDGKYDYQIGSVSGYIANVTSGTVTVQGNAVTISLDFHEPSGKPSTFLGLPGISGYIVMGLAVAIVLAIGVVVLWRRRKTSSSSLPPPLPQSPPSILATDRTTDTPQPPNPPNNMGQ